MIFMWKRLKDILNEVDAVMITSAPNLRYFSGFCGGEGVCLIGNGFRYLFVDSRYTVAAKAEARDFEVIEFKGGRLCDELNSKLSAHSIENLGFEDREMTAAEFEMYREKLSQKTMTGLGSRLTMLRMIKTDEEIRLMKAAEGIGDMAFAEVLPMIKAGVSECEIAAELEYRMRRRGADKTSFDTIVVSGVKSSMPHGMPSSKKLERGDFVTMDFGCVYNGYCSDMTRTVVIETASDKQIKIYNTVLKAQLEGLCAIRAGIKGKDADSEQHNDHDAGKHGRTADDQGDLRASGHFLFHFDSSLSSSSTGQWSLPMTSAKISAFSMRERRRSETMK